MRYVIIPLFVIGMLYFIWRTIVVMNAYDCDLNKMPETSMILCMGTMAISAIMLLILSVEFW